MSYFIDNLSLSLLEIYGDYMHLKLFVDSDDIELKNKYIQVIEEHNSKLTKNITYPDAGFDLFVPNNTNLKQSNVNKIDYNIICSAKIHRKGNSFNTGFYMYPRSSISKSQLRLANNVGIIDSGYRGHLICMFDLINTNFLSVKKFDRYVQICSPGLMPIIVEYVNSIQELGEETERGIGGFGSTGI
jgi:dUTP pyrophosphatase